MTGVTPGAHEGTASGAFATGCCEGDQLPSNDMELVVLCVPKSRIQGANVLELPVT